MFERFDDEARRIILGAHPQARALRHERVKTPHILLSLMAMDECDPALLLAEQGVTYDSVCFVIETNALLGDRPPARIFHNQLEFQALIHDAVSIAETWGKQAVSPMLMLLTLLHNPFSRVSHVITAVGANRLVILGMAQAIIKRS